MINRHIDALHALDVESELSPLVPAKPMRHRRAREVGQVPPPVPTSSLRPPTPEERLQRMCLRKRQHETYAAARLAMKTVLRRNPRPQFPYHVYPCPNCGKYHWGRMLTGRRPSADSPSASPPT